MNCIGTLVNEIVSLEAAPRGSARPSELHSCGSGAGRGSTPQICHLESFQDSAESQTRDSQSSTAWRCFNARLSPSAQPNALSSGASHERLIVAKRPDPRRRFRPAAASCSLNGSSRARRGAPGQVRCSCLGGKLAGNKLNSSPPIGCSIQD